MVTLLSFRHATIADSAGLDKFHALETARDPVYQFAPQAWHFAPAGVRFGG